MKIRTTAPPSHSAHEDSHKVIAVGYTHQGIKTTTAIGRRQLKK